MTVSSVSAPVEDRGYWSATFNLVLTAQGPSGTRTRPSSGVLILEAGGWRFFSGTAPH
ncbi:MAG TPA: hypothetical protein VNF71_14465 [Acidimicrobiales bacterium]|nr:hypothetical protein [Acidimicrobiales bacterium]